MKQPGGYRWVARAIFVTALLAWGHLAVRAATGPEPWPDTRHRAAAFIVMVAAGIFAFPSRKMEEGEEETL